MARFVFGMGIALINHWKIIKKNFNPDYGIDNDKSKWGREDTYTNLTCIAPEALSGQKDAEVLITIGDPYVIETVKKQLDDMHIQYKVLIQEIDKWTSEENMPKRLQSMSLNEKKILLFNTPEHDNIGDHLITLAELDFLKRYFQDYKIYEITDIEYSWYHLKIKKNITVNDIILITGGGFLGSLWLYNGEENVRNILKEYPDNKVIILPQTIYFEKNKRGEKELQVTKQIYNRHQNLIVCAREEKSYETFSQILKPHIRVELLPDIALLYHIDSVKKERKGNALLCLRNDKEKVLTDIEQREIEQKLVSQGWEVKKTSMHSGKFLGIDERKKQVYDKLEQIQNSGLVVTDTLHCMLAATITGTPCIAFNNLSDKVKNVYKWIEKMSYVQFCDEIAEFESKVKALDVASEICNNIQFSEYEKKLEKIIRGI
jgi:exopolysaccharide biosynthesis predicted pyruvyltransferase EpsI